MDTTTQELLARLIAAIDDAEGCPHIEALRDAAEDLANHLGFQVHT